jgi:hypothetical protein
MEGYLITFILTALGGLILNYLTSKGKVSDKDLQVVKNDIAQIKKDREKSWTAHREFCPEKRDIMSETDHELICQKNLAPIHIAIAEIKETNKITSAALATMSTSLAQMATAQARAVTSDDLERILKAVMK